MSATQEEACKWLSYAVAGDKGISVMVAACGKLQTIACLLSWRWTGDEGQDRAYGLLPALNVKYCHFMIDRELHGKEGFIHGVSDRCS